MLDRVLANWPLKLLALVLAFAIWVSVTGENRILQDLQVPLEIRPSEDHVLATPPPTTVTVRLRGLESAMRRLDPVPMVVRVDVTELPLGDQEVVLSKDDLRGVPRGVEVVFIDPERVTVTIDRRLRRQLSVEPTFLGQPPDGFSVYGSRISPQAVPVEGPDVQVRGLEVLHTSPIRLDQRTSSFTARVSVAPESSQVRPLDNRGVEVQVFIDRTAIERRFNDVPVRVVGAGGATADPPPTLDLTLSGPPALLERLTRERVRLVADGTGLASDGTGRQVDVRVEFVDVSAEDRAKIGIKAISRRRVAVRQVDTGRAS